jgi:hypothetical protein
MNGAYSTPPEIGRWQQRALIVGAVFAVLFALGAIFNRPQFFRSYLVAYVFWTGIALGSLAILLLQHLTGGAWGLVIRRVLEAATRTLPLMALLFIPIILGAHDIYPWTDHVKMSETPALEQKARFYLNLPFFSARAAFYFATWILTAYFLNKWSLDQDRTADRRFGKRMRMISAPGLLLFFLTVTFASVDWAMSLDPKWFSTIYGLLFAIAWALSALAFVIAVMSFLANREPMSRIVRPNHFQDLGKLMLAFVMLWAYFAFSQFLIVWYGNLPEEIRWYLPRVGGGWGVIAVSVIFFHFAFPFLLLLSASLKRNARRLVMLAGLILVMRLIDFFWMIAPEFHKSGLHAGFHVSWMDVVAPVALGGLWFAMFAWQLGKRSLIPINDSQYDSVLSQAQAPVHSEH